MNRNESTITGSSMRSRIRRRNNIRMMQNVLLVWLDENIDENNVSFCDTVSQLRRIVTNTNTFTDYDKCIEFIENVDNDQICLIVSGVLGSQIVPHIHNISHVDSIFVFCGNKKRNEKWARNWPKVKGVFTAVDPMCEGLKQAVRTCEQDSMSFSFVPTTVGTTGKNLDRLDPMFMYTQILKEILFSITFEEQHIQEFVDYCYDVFADNKEELIRVKQFKEEYHQKTPIWLYTSESFLYPTINRALRLSDIDIIIKLGFFISDLHRQIDELHSIQFKHQQINDSFTVYRGQGMSKTDFSQMNETIGGLMSFKSFLSTSKNRNVSLSFAYATISKPDSVGILFVMNVDPSQSTTSFACINDESAIREEDEVLFSMHTVFRIQAITSMGANNRLFRVDLVLTNDSDPDLHVLTEHIRNENFPQAEGWYRLGLVLIKIGQLEEAQQVYELLLDQATMEHEKGSIYHQLGWIKNNQGEYQEAIALYEKSIAIYKQTLPANHSDFSASYNNIGLVYYNMGEYSKALEFHEKALKIREEILSPNDPELASSYNNIGLVYYNMGEYTKALSSYETSLEIRKQSLPSTHPELGSSYNNIGLVYNNMGEYSKALSSYEQSLTIRKQSLPSTHPDLGSSYNNIGLTYYNMGEYSKALSSYEESLDIRKQSLPSTHPELGSSYNNIGLVYNNMGEYSKALSSHEQSLTIRKQSLPSNHPDLGSSYNNIGLVYNNMGEYSKALSSHEQSLTIRKQSLPSTHPDLGSSYNNIGLAYYNMGDYSKALSSYKQSLEIRKQSLPSNHPELASSYNNIGLVYCNMGKYAKALSYQEEALEIRKQSLSSNHSDLAMSYNNIGLVCHNMCEYSKAFSFYERAVDIAQNALPSTHPLLALYRRNLGLVKGL